MCAINVSSLLLFKPCAVHIVPVNAKVIGLEKKVMQGVRLSLDQY